MKQLVITFLFLLLTVLGFPQGVTNVGTDFWVAFPPNATTAQIKLFISSNFSTSGTVASDFPGVNQNFTVIPGVVTQVSLPSGVCLQGGKEAKGIHVVSGEPISVYGLNSVLFSTDAFLALPVNALGIDYWILSYETTMVNLGSCFSIVATQDGTDLTIFNHQTNSTTNINLRKGEAYHVEAPIVGEDLTGSRIQSNFPVAVFGSSDETLIPNAGCGAADHVVEQMFPYYSWGKNFVTVPLAGRDDSGDIFRIVTAQDGTEITINGTLVATINSGDYYQAELTGNNSITTSEPVILAQFAKGIVCSGNITGDPFMMLIPPKEQFLTNYTICNAAGFASNWVNVVAPDYALGTIFQDGVLIPNSAFTQIGTTNYYGAQRSVTEGSHTFTSTIPFGVFVYGWNPSDSYGYPGGCSLSPVGTVNSVTLSPPSATGILDVSTLCFTAHVEDNLSAPVAGVLVTFNISGISNITGTAYTDASGNAQYCYARTGTTTGIDSIYAECFGYISDTSTATWILSCTNPTSSGSIGNSQAGCGSFIPAPLTSITLPSGQSGTLEYKWQQSIISGVTGFSDIGSNTPGYSPGSVSQTTWFRRVARVDCMPDWTGAVMTDALEMTITTPLIPAVTISADLLQPCAGETVTFTATPINGGTNPVYQWKVNGVNAGTNGSTYSYVPVNGNCIICELTSDLPCTSGNPATSNMICMTVNPNLIVSVAVSASANPVCQGSSVTFTAAPTNGGTAPVYQWYKGTTPVGSNSDTFSYIPVNGDVITVVMTSNASQCLTGSPATSNAIIMTVNPLLPASVTIAADANPVCAGTSVKFTATPVNGGTAPVYQWYKGLTPVGSNSDTYSYIPVNGDVITVVMTSNSSPCLTGSPATSNTVTMTVNPLLPASVTITVSANPVCAGISVTFTATPVNGGTTPIYQWKVNGNNAGNNSPNFSYIPQTGDSIRCMMTSNLACASNNPASSNKIVMTASSVPVVTFTRCFDSITTVNAKPIKLKGGIPLGGTYSGPGVNSITSVFTPSAAGIGTKTITYSYTNVALCSATKTKAIIVQSAQAFTCGNNLTDIRDGKVYPTIQLGSQCWMATDLDYGLQIPETSHQRDNCVPEKYKSAAGSQQSAVYQWDELMLYSETPGLQGLCPPGWHIPTETDWSTLFAIWTNNGFAGAPLKYSGYSGFNALMSGVIHLNIQWDYQDVATFFWSSSSYGPMKAWSHGINDYDPSVAAYPSSRANAFSVRCLKD